MRNGLQRCRLLYQLGQHCMFAADRESQSDRIFRHTHRLNDLIRVNNPVWRLRNVIIGIIGLRNQNFRPSRWVIRPKRWAMLPSNAVTRGWNWTKRMESNQYWVDGLTCATTHACRSRMNEDWIKSILHLLGHLTPLNPYCTYCSLTN